MTKNFLLDTNTVSYIVNGKSPNARSRLELMSTGQSAYISAITEAEILYGLAKKPDARRLHIATAQVLSRLQILPWAREEAQIFGRLRARLEAQGKTLGPLDMLIAAHAIAIGATLVTSDKALLRLEGLPAAENWADDI